jgi:hypothetical protein
MLQPFTAPGLGFTVNQKLLQNALALGKRKG